MTHGNCVFAVERHSGPPSACEGLFWGGPGRCKRAAVWDVINTAGGEMHGLCEFCGASYLTASLAVVESKTMPAEPDWEKLA